MADRSNGLLVPFGLRDRRMWRPDQVERGLACGCACPACGGALEARNSGAIRRPYFAHHVGSACRAGFETAVHLMAKQVLVEAGRVLLPAWAGGPGMPAQLTLKDAWGITHFGARIEREARMARLSSAVAERAIGGIRPDVLARDEAGDLLIEVRVRHAVDRAKLEYVRARRYRMIEIDLSKVTAPEAADADAFSGLVLDGADNRLWLSLPDAEDEWRAAKAELEAQVAALKREVETLPAPAPLPVEAVRLPPLDMPAVPVPVRPSAPVQTLHNVEIGCRLWHTGLGTGTVEARVTSHSPVYQVDFDGHGPRTIVLDDRGAGRTWQVLPPE